eukprot:403348844
MKHLLKKSVQISFASIVAIKSADIYKKQEFNYRFPLQARLAEAYQGDDYVGNLIKSEFSKDFSKLEEVEKARYDFKLKTREQHLKEIMDEKNEYDILVIGGGASGAGVALEAASRGLKCAVVEKYDFASGTSSRSTKMAHGGIRYFEKMMMLEGDPFENYELLKETLHERNYFLFAAPFQNKPLNLVIPSSSLFKTAFFYYPGALLYHFMYLRELVKSEYQTGLGGPKILGKGKVRDMFKNLTAIHGQNGVLMHEAQMMDSRMNLNTLLTSTVNQYIPGMKGANIANYTEFVDYIKNEHGKIVGAVLQDNLTKKQFKVKCKVLVNCAGIHADELRLKDNPQAQRRVTGARGTHLMFQKDLLPENSGIIIPKTKDGRLIFIINYLGHAMVGTTDDKCELTHTPQPLQQDIDFIVSELSAIFGKDYDFKNNMISAWSGIRPLVVETEEDKKRIKDIQELEDSTYYRKMKRRVKRGIIRLGQKIHGAPTGDTASLSRNHVIEVSNSNLVSLMGGKWTSFRKMGEETIDRIVHQNLAHLDVKQEKSVTDKFKLLGSYTAVEIKDGIQQLPEEIQDQYEDHFVFVYDLPRDAARHIYHSYGTAALRVVRLGMDNKLNTRLHPDYPYLKSEVLYAVRQEMAEKPNDILCRRIPMAFVNKELATQLLKEVVEIMAKEKKWSKSQKQAEYDEALKNLEYMK